jgi:probable lipoprotein NlpC
MRAHLRHAALVIVFLLPIASACSTARIYSPAAAAGRASHERPPIHDGEGVVTVLYQQFVEWRGVRYRYGGLDKSGVDCSGFVYLTLKRRFGLEAPRSTKGLSEYGIEVSRSNLRAGDLVFFKTGRSKKHVGIYVEDDKFLHASTSRGVMLSDMEDDYWARRFWQARRVPSLSAGI